jgi:hypothetical protein
VRTREILGKKSPEEGFGDPRQGFHERVGKDEVSRSGNGLSTGR